MTNIFKAVISRDNGCPWGETGMTSTKWLDMPLQFVYIADLVATQPGILFAPLIKPSTPAGLDPHPHVIEWRGERYLEDGHHRVMRRALAGCRYVTARYMVVADDRAAALMRSIDEYRAATPCAAGVPVKVSHVAWVSQQSLDENLYWPV